MSPPTGRARSDESKRLRKKGLLAAALDVFYERGFNAARMDDIAERAGLSKGTVYLYFSSKDDLFRELIESVAMPNLERLEKIADQAPSLEAFLDELVDFASSLVLDSDIPRFHKVMIGESQTFPDLTASYRRRVLDRLVAALTRVLEVAQARGEAVVPEVDHTAKLVLAPIVFFSIWQIVFVPEDGPPEDVEAALRVHTDLLRKALLKPQG